MEISDVIFDEAIYKLKDGTATSYYWQSGSKLLPNRMSVTPFEVSRTKKKGRNLEPVAGQLKASFSKVKYEASRLKQNYPYNVQTQLWVNEQYKLFMGYGTIGISGYDGKVSYLTETNDMILIYQESPFILRIFLWHGHIDVNTKDIVFKAALAKIKANEN